ncbi:MAG: DUF418 domain-containing protein [Bacteroidales bacterium]
MEEEIVPVSIKDRISSIDILRGFALLGILLVNILGFNASFFNFGGFYQHLPDPVQAKFYTVYISLTADKFIFLFGFLFGYGICLQYNKFEEKSGKFSRFFSRRMLVLSAFGILHILLLWAGDILLTYSIAGLLMLLFRKLSTKWLIIMAVFFYFFIGIWLTIGVKLPLPDALSLTCTECLEKAKIIYTNGSYSECLVLRLKEYFSFRYINAFYYLPKIIGITIFGFLAAKYKFHQNVKMNWLRWSIVLLIIALLAVVFYFNYEKIVDFKSLFANAVYMTSYEFTNIFIAFSYLLFILLISSNATIARFLKPVALMGQMSLSNYIMQSIILSIVFYGWGFGIFGQTSLTLLLLIAVCIYFFQLFLCILWFKFYTQGPLEKLWRMISYKEITA